MLSRRVKQLVGGTVALTGLLLWVMLLSYHPQDPSWNTAVGKAKVVDGTVHNLLSAPGAHLADVLMQTLGGAGYFFGLITVAWGWRIAANRGLPHLSLRIAFALAAVLLAAAGLAGMPAHESWPVGDHYGGSAGALLRLVFLGVFGHAPGAGGSDLAALVAGGLAVVTLIGAFGFSPREWWSGVRGAGHLVGAAGRNAQEAARHMGHVGRSGAHAAASAGRVAARQTGHILRREPSFGPAETDEETCAPAARRGAPYFDAAPHDDTYDYAEEPLPAPAPGGRCRPAIVTPAAKAPEPPRHAAAAIGRQPALDLTAPNDYELPPLDLLEEPDPGARPVTLNEASLQQNAELLESVLGDFGVRGQIQKVHPGPVVTLYELEPAPGTKSSRVIGLADDIARSMSAVSVRVAVVPGRNVIGIEMPNQRREIVLLRELLSSDAYERTAGRLPLILGKDIAGAPIITDLARMPHLLIAGTTGSGKSVGINTMILSLLYRLPPDKCRFIMVDPKMLELSVYDGIPHLLTPVVTDPKKAVVAMRWAVREMEQRYEAMARLNVRNIDNYNTRIQEVAAAGEKLTRRAQTGFDKTTGKPTFEDQTIDPVTLPYIVVIVDEMADLMLVAGKDLEACIQRLAQMARAAGIHLIMATQRPSVDVITGTIKANFPTRISFQVTSKIDSRTILGEQGAEQLLGQGDMLYMAAGGRITRVHGPFVSDGEVEDVVRFVRAQGEPDYIHAITEDDDADEIGGV
ncbi:MAG TPA: DNA translocase FtsK, partial [Azospirillaceae bacterium]|nr:DNA translocase FtsK [Azospirillaceae bacterium]